MTYYWKFVVVYLSIVLLCSAVNIYAGLGDGIAALVSVILIFLAVPVWIFWAGKGQAD
ncbi:hypothetical protein [Pseudomonas sp. dw_612]|uniref:hypothetical protein n=1 Tax=Pseudomonas sp. dw_612 TaxID=2720080 RepID=UPI001BD4CD96|nr:hypothetical protein [Pseudomonas sp. dw_612]